MYKKKKKRSRAAVHTIRYKTIFFRFNITTCTTQTFNVNRQTTLLRGPRRRNDIIIVFIRVRRRDAVLYDKQVCAHEY